MAENLLDGVEEWRDIKGYEGFYQASSFGRIRSVDRKCWNGKTMAFMKGKILKPALSGDGRNYLIVHLSKHNKQKTLSVHRLIAGAFIPNPLMLPEINHKDENPSNNNVSNLEWCTRHYNTNYGTHNEKLRNTKEKRYGKPILQFDMLGNLITEYPTLMAAERATGFHNGNISHCCRGNCSYAYGYVWKFKEENINGR